MGYSSHMQFIDSEIGADEPKFSVKRDRTEEEIKSIQELDAKLRAIYASPSKLRHAETTIAEALEIAYPRRMGENFREVAERLRQVRLKLEEYEGGEE